MSYTGGGRTLPSWISLMLGCWAANSCRVWRQRHGGAGGLEATSSTAGLPTRPILVPKKQTVVALLWLGKLSGEGVLLGSVLSPAW